MIHDTQGDNIPLLVDYYVIDGVIYIISVTLGELSTETNRQILDEIMEAENERRIDAYNRRRDNRTFYAGRR